MSMCTIPMPTKLTAARPAPSSSGTDSPAYQEIIPLRTVASQGALLIVEGA
jgi:uncharacterized protein (DUF1330 family)